LILKKKAQEYFETSVNIYHRNMSEVLHIKFGSKDFTTARNGKVEWLPNFSNRYIL